MIKIIKLLMAALAAGALPFVFAYQAKEAKVKDKTIDSLKVVNARLLSKADSNSASQRAAVLEEINRFLFQQKTAPTTSIDIPDRITISIPIQDKSLNNNIPLSADSANQDSVRNLQERLAEELARSLQLRGLIFQLDSALTRCSSESTQTATRISELCAIVKFTGNNNERTLTKAEIQQLVNYLNYLCGVTESWRTKVQQPRNRLFDLLNKN